MKAKTLLATATAVACTAWLVSGETNIVANVRSEIVTNWSDTGYASTTLMYPPEANTYRYYENGIIMSNTIVEFEWDGKLQSIVVRSDLIATTNRSYTIKEQRVYEGY